MSNKTLEERKESVLFVLNELQEQVETLIRRIEKAKATLADVKTEEDAERWEKENILEDDLSHIELF